MPQNGILNSRAYLMAEYEPRGQTRPGWESHRRRRRPARRRDNARGWFPASLTLPTAKGPFRTGGRACEKASARDARISQIRVFPYQRNRHRVEQSILADDEGEWGWLSIASRSVLISSPSDPSRPRNRNSSRLMRNSRIPWLCKSRGRW